MKASDIDGMKALIVIFMIFICFLLSIIIHRLHDIEKALGIQITNVIPESRIVSDIPRDFSALMQNSNRE